MAILSKTNKPASEFVIERPFAKQVAEIRSFYTNTQRKDLNTWDTSEYIYDINPPQFLYEAIFRDYNKIATNVVVAHNEYELEITFEYLDGTTDVFSETTLLFERGQALRIAEWLCNVAYLQQQ